MVSWIWNWGQQSAFGTDELDMQIWEEFHLTLFFICTEIEVRQESPVEGYSLLCHKGRFEAHLEKTSALKIVCNLLGDKETSI